MNSEPEIVKNFLVKTLRLQAWEKRIDCFTLGEGVIPANFKVLHDHVRDSDTMIADFGESAIGRVAPVDSGFWWIILLRAYTKSIGDHYLAEMPDCQRGIRLILTLCLSKGFDTFPTLLYAEEIQVPCLLWSKMITVSIAPNPQAAAIVSGFFYALFALFLGFYITRKQLLKWWVWYYWISPLSWTVYDLIISQYRDITQLIEVDGKKVGTPLNEYLAEYFGYNNDFMGAMAAVLFSFIFQLY